MFLGKLQYYPVVGGIRTFKAREAPVAFCGQAGTGIISKAFLCMCQEFKHAFVVIKGEHPGNDLAGRVHRADALRGRLGPEKLAVDFSLASRRRFLDDGGLKRNGNEILIDAGYYFGPGKYRLTGGAGKYSTPLVIDREVDEDPQDHWLVLLT